MAKKNYVDSKELEGHWSRWIDTGDCDSWNKLLSGVYKICQGVVVNFNPRNEEEHSELVHEAFILTIAKIKDGRLTFEPGRAPVFNLLTTTIFRQLFSKLNKDNRRKGLLAKHRDRVMKEMMP